MVDGNEADTIPSLLQLIGSDGVIDHAQTIAFLGFKEPSHPCLPVSGKLEQKLLLMAAVGDRPNGAGEIVPVGSSIGSTKQFLKGLI